MHSQLSWLVSFASRILWRTTYHGKRFFLFEPSCHILPSRQNDLLLALMFVWIATEPLSRAINQQTSQGYIEQFRYRLSPERVDKCCILPPSDWASDLWLLASCFVPIKSGFSVYKPRQFVGYYRVTPGRYIMVLIKACWLAFYSSPSIEHKVLYHAVSHIPKRYS